MQEIDAFWQRLSRLQSANDLLRDLGAKERIRLPRIVTLGCQRVGKTLLLNSILGVDLLPVCVTTARPLEISLLRSPGSGRDPAKFYGEFEEVPGKVFTSPAAMAEQIEELTHAVTGAGRDPISGVPIRLRAYLPGAPVEFEFVDVPGLMRESWQSLSDPPVYIEVPIPNINTHYASDTKSIVLLVLPATHELAGSEEANEGLRVDPRGHRTIPVLTKIDIMDMGTNARKVLQGQEVKIGRGFVGVKLRSCQDIWDKKSLLEGIAEENDVFADQNW